MERWFLKFTKEILLSYLEKLKTKLTLLKKFLSKKIKHLENLLLKNSSNFTQNNYINSKNLLKD